MAIEGSTKKNSDLLENSEAEKSNNFSHSNEVFLAGAKVKHPLMEEMMVIYGFIVEDSEFNPDDLIIQGLKIKYNSSFTTQNEIIYTKVILDKKENYKNHLTSEYPFEYAGRYRHRYGETNTLKESQKESLYYMYDRSSSEKAECGADEIYVICKYIKNGAFKHLFFNLHELEWIG